MRKAAIWLAVISMTVFVIAWGIMGVKLLDGNYDITVESYTGGISLVIFFVCFLGLRFSRRCPHCQRIVTFDGKYCPYCGKTVE